MQLRLVLIVDNTRGQSILVTGSPWSIGRNDDCNLRLKNQSVSRKHCELKLKEVGWTVRDLGSTYGTTINNFPVPQDKRALLKSGDRLKIGQYIFEIEIQTEKPVDGPADEQIASLDDSLPDLDSLLDRALDAPLPTQTWNPLMVNQKVESGPSDGNSKPAEETLASESDTVPSSAPADKDAITELRKKLRAPQAQDSQEAAEIALRRLFGRG